MSLIICLGNYSHPLIECMKEIFFSSSFDTEKFPVGDLVWDQALEQVMGEYRDEGVMAAAFGKLAS